MSSGGWDTTSRQHQNDTTHTAIPKQSMPLTRAVYRGGKRKKGRSLRLNTMWIELVRRDIKEHQTFGKTESLDESHIVVFFWKICWNLGNLMFSIESA